MKLVYFPDPILAKELKDVDLENPGFDPVQLKKDMVELMISKKGLGLSACQVGLDYKLFVMGENAETAIMVINPEIVSVSSEEINEVEGCLSFPDVFMQIKRPAFVIAKWFDENMQPQEGKVEGYGARCFIHEYEHLQGITFNKVVSRVKYERALKKKTKIVKQRGMLAKYLSALKQTEDHSVRVTKANDDVVLDLNTDVSNLNTAAAKE